jgi:hypothetical protein
MRRPLKIAMSRPIFVQLKSVRENEAAHFKMSLWTEYDPGGNGDHFLDNPT